MLLIIITSGVYEMQGTAASKFPSTPPVVDETLKNLSDIPQKSNRADVHCSDEDAWRLLCSFHTVEVASKRVNLRVRESGSTPSDREFVLSLQDFISGLFSHDKSTAYAIIEELYTRKNVTRKIGLKKSLEYFLYEAIPPLPSSDC